MIYVVRISVPMEVNGSTHPQVFTLAGRFDDRDCAAAAIAIIEPAFEPVGGWAYVQEMPS